MAVTDSTRRKSTAPPVAGKPKPAANKKAAKGKVGERCRTCRHPFDDALWSPCDVECVHGGPVKVGRSVEDSLTAEQGTAGKLAGLRPGEVLASGRQPTDPPTDRCRLCVRRGVGEAAAA